MALAGAGRVHVAVSKPPFRIAATSSGVDWRAERRERANLAEIVPSIGRAGEALNKTPTYNWVRTLIFRRSVCLSSCYLENIHRALSQLSVARSRVKMQRRVISDRSVESLAESCVVCLQWCASEKTKLTIDNVFSLSITILIDRNLVCRWGLMLVTL